MQSSLGKLNDVADPIGKPGTKNIFCFVLYFNSHPVESVAPGRSAARTPSRSYASLPSASGPRSSGRTVTKELNKLTCFIYENSFFTLRR